MHLSPIHSDIMLFLKLTKISKSKVGIISALATSTWVFYFIELIDQDALIEALQEKRIRGAGLDVMTPEPLPLDNPLMTMNNVGKIE